MPKRRHPVALSLPAMLLACLILAGASPAHALGAHAAAEHRIVQVLLDQKAASTATTNEWAAKLLVVVHHFASAEAAPARARLPQAPLVLETFAAPVRTTLTPAHLFGTGAQAAP